MIHYFTVIWFIRTLKHQMGGKSGGVMRTAAFISTMSWQSIFYGAGRTHLTQYRGMSEILMQDARKHETSGLLGYRCPSDVLLSFSLMSGMSGNGTFRYGRLLTSASNFGDKIRIASCRRLWFVRPMVFPQVQRPLRLAMNLVHRISLSPWRKLAFSKIEKKIRYLGPAKLRISCESRIHPCL